MKRPHLSLSLSRELWNELLRSALPIGLAGGELDLLHNARIVARQLQVKERVAGLLEDRRAPTALTRVGDRARDLWRARRSSLGRRARQVIRVEGTWRVEVDQVGTELTYSKQRVGADAYVRGVAEGRIILLAENIELPFVIERRVGASLAIGDIRYDPGHRAVIGSVQDLGVYLGDNAVLQLLARLAEYGLEQQLPRVNPVPILRRDQVEELVGPMGGALKMQMGVEDLDLNIDEHDMTLRVRFGFTQGQLTEREPTDLGD